MAAPSLRWGPRGGKGGVPASSWGSASCCAVGEGATCLALPPPPQNREFWGAGLQAGEGNGGLPGGLQSPLPAAGPPQALSAPLRGGMQAPPEPPPPQGAAACPGAGAPGWSRGSVWGGFRGWRRLARFNGRTARAAIKITLINKDGVGGCLQCQGWVVVGGGGPPDPQPHDVPPHWRAAGVPPPRRAPHPVWAAPGGDPHLGDELPPHHSGNNPTASPFPSGFPPSLGVLGRDLHQKCRHLPQELSPRPRKTCFLFQEAFMAKHAHPAGFFQIPYSCGWLFAAGGLLLCTGWLQQDPGALGAGTGNGTMQGSGKWEPFMGAGSSALAPGDLWGRAGLSPTRGMAWRGVVAGDAGGDQHLAPSLPVPGG